VEDVILRYLNLSEHDRGEAIQNREYLISMLQRLKRESEMTTPVANPGAMTEKIEEIQQEIFSSQQQLQIIEERLSLFEPDPVAFGSTIDIDGCEKFLMDVLARVVERKNNLLSSHMAPFDATATGMQGADGTQMYMSQAEGMGTFGGEAAMWDPDGGADPGHSMFGASDPLIYLRDHGVYDANSQVAGLHHGGDPCAAGGAACVDGVAGGHAAADVWRQEYTCTELLATLIPTTPFPLMPHCLAPEDQYLSMHQGMVAQEQVEASASCSYVPSDETTGTPVMAYDSNAPPPTGEHRLT
ncbi:hypothetical protein ABZP36_025221, partial [Zizania latifolia]